PVPLPMREMSVTRNAEYIKAIGSMRNGTDSAWSEVAADLVAAPRCAVPTPVLKRKSGGSRCSEYVDPTRTPRDGTNAYRRQVPTKVLWRTPWRQRTILSPMPKMPIGTDSKDIQPPNGNRDGDNALRGKACTSSRQRNRGSPDCPVPVPPPRS